MSNRSQQVRLGLFVLAFLVLLVGGLVLLAGTRVWESRDVYTVRFESSVAGLEVGAPVKVNGVRVGRVDSIALDPQNISVAVVRLSLHEDIPLRRDAEAVVQLQGITGLRFIEIQPGSQEAALLEPPAEIRAGSSDIDIWTGRAEDVVTQIQILVTRLLQLTDADGMEYLEGIIEETHTLMTRAARLAAQLNDTVAENRPELRRAIKGVASVTESATKASDEIGETAKVAREDLHGALAAGRKAAVGIDQMATKGTEFLTAADDTVDGVRNVLSEERLGRAISALVAALEAISQAAARLERTMADSETDLAATLRAVRAASEQLEEFSRTLRDNPGMLLRGGGMPETEVPR